MCQGWSEGLKLKLGINYQVHGCKAFDCNLLCASTLLGMGCSVELNQGASHKFMPQWFVDLLQFWFLRIGAVS